MKEGEFKFEIAPLTENAPMPVSPVTTNLSTGYFQFGTMEFTEVGTYKYVVTEINEGKDEHICI